MDAAGNQVVAGALRGALHQDRRLDLEKFALVEKVTDVLDGAVPDDQVVRHSRAPKVEIAVFQPEPLVDLGVVRDAERQRQRSVEHPDLIGQNLNLAARKVGVDCAGWSGRYLALN